MSEIPFLVVMEQDGFLAHLSYSKITSFHIQYIPFLQESTKLKAPDTCIQYWEWPVWSTILRCLWDWWTNLETFSQNKLQNVALYLQAISTIRLIYLGFHIG